MKVGTKLASYLFKHLNKCHGKAEKWAEDVLRRLSSSIDVGGSDPIYHGQCGSIILYVYIYIYIYKCVSTTKGTKAEHTRQDSPWITE